MSTLIQELRATTSGIHKRLEETYISRIILSPSVTLDDYTSYLERNYLLHRDVEQVMLPAAKDMMQQLGTRKKVPLLAVDLQALGQKVPVGEPSDPGHSQPVNSAFALGCLYVTEGSALGGQYILKNLKGVLGDQVKHAHRFLNVYGANTGAYWKSFMALVEEFGATAGPETRTDVLAGATFCFNKAYSLFNQPISQPQV